MTDLRTPRRLGRTGLQVFPLGLGGHVYPVGEDAGSFRTPDERAELVSFLYRNGVNYFDTTWFNEVELLADSLKRADIPCDRVVISMQYVDGMSDPGMHDSLRMEIEKRLSLFGLSTAPLFLLGVGNEDIGYGRMVESMEALARMRDCGLVRNIGFSCHSLPHFPLAERLVTETDLPDYMMIRFNPRHPDAMSGLFRAAVEHDVGIVLMKLFCWDCGPGQWGRRISVFESDSRPEVPGMTAAQANLAWCLGSSPCATSAVSMNTRKEAEENLAALDPGLDSAGGLPGIRELIPDFDRYAGRLWSREGLKEIVTRTESGTVRERAAKLLDELDEV